MYQKIYIRLIRTPFLKRYLFKLRRRLEIVNIDDEYTTRKEAASLLSTKILKLLLLIFGQLLFWLYIHHQY